MSLRKINTLRADELKEQLRARELSTAGTKNELMLRLSECVNADEVEVQSNESVLQAQVNELRVMLESMMIAVKGLVDQSQTNNNNASVERERDRVGVDRVINSPQSSSVTVGRSASVKEIAETIPEYDPTSENSLTVDQFVDRVNSAIEAYQWDEKCLLLAVYSKLKGAARLWLDASPKFHSTWNDFSNSLVEEFGYKLNEAEVHIKMSNATRKQGEKIMDYCFRVSGLGRRYGLSESAIIKYLRDGLKHRELQVAISAVRFKSLKEMRETIEDYLQNSVLTKTIRNETADKQYANRGKNENEKSGYDKTSLKCYNCQELGHIARNCKKPKQPHRCKDCNKFHDGGEPVNCGKKLNVKRAQVNQKMKFGEKYISISGKTFLSFIDTGSECSMIKRSVANTLAIPYQKCTMIIYGICGGKNCLTEKVNTNIGLDNEVVNLDLFIVDDDILSTDILLGQDIFQGRDITIEISNKNFEFSTQAAKAISSNIICNVNDEQTKDKLQKFPNENTEELDTASLKVSKTTLETNDWIYSMQQQDEKIKEIINKVKNGDNVLNEEYTVEDERLYRKEKGKRLWVVPNAIRYRIIQSMHEKVKH